MTSNHRNLKRSQRSMRQRSINQRSMSLSSINQRSVFRTSDLCRSRRQSRCQSRREDCRKSLKAKILQTKGCGSDFATLGLWLLV